MKIEITTIGDVETIEIDTKCCISDSQRIDYLELVNPGILTDSSEDPENPRYSVDGGTTWHPDLRSAIDEDMA